MNVINSNNKIFKYESFWRNNKKDNTRDDNDKLFPFPKEGKKWSEINQFLNQLVRVENNSPFFNDQKKDCILCHQKNITSGYYKAFGIIWEDGLKHYIKMHNIKPSGEFINLIYKYIPKNNKTINLTRSNKITKVKNIYYVKFDRNQIQIIDALMKHGGHAKRYTDTYHKDMFRYSEHAGLLDFKNINLDRIVVSGKTNRIDVGDDDIFLPDDMKEAYDYEYIFHTHPPTPVPGGRVKDGFLYESPSISDIFHFIDHYNNGITCGSLVITPEGLYNIRKLVFDKKQIKINEDKLFSDLNEEISAGQTEAIHKFSDTFNTYFFYTRIAQDTEYIDNINHVLNKFGLHIDYYPRIKDSANRWIIDTVHLPMMKS